MYNVQSFQNPGMQPNMGFVQQPVQQMNDWPLDRFIVNPQSFRFSPDNYPAVQFPLLVPEIGPLVPIIAATIGNEICQSAQMNNIRVYAFNQLSANNFNNPDFTQVVQLATDIISVMLKKRTGNYPASPMPEDIPRECRNALIIKCALNVANSQMLASSLSPEQINQTNQIIQGFQNQAPEIEQLRQQLMQYHGGRLPMFTGVRPQSQYSQPNNQQLQFQQPQQNTPYFQQNNLPNHSRAAGFNNNQQDTGRRQYDSPPFVPVQFVNGVPVAANQQPQQFSQQFPNQQQPQQNNQSFQHPQTNAYKTASSVGQRFAPVAPPTAIQSEWNSTPSTLPQGCPPPLNISAQASVFKMPEIQTQNTFEFPEDIVVPFNNPKLDYVEEGQSVTEVSKNNGEELRWSPSELQPFRIHWDFLKHKIILKKVSYKGRYFIIQQRTNLSEAEMDEARHAIGPKTLANKVLVANLQADRLIPSDGLEEGRTVRAGPKIEELKSTPIVDNTGVILNSSGVPVKPNVPELNISTTPLGICGLGKAPVEDLDSNNVPKWTDVGFLSDAIHNARIQHASLPNNRTRVSRERYLVPKVFVTKKAVESLFDSMTSEKSFKHLSGNMRAVLDGTIKTSRHHRDFIGELDNYLTGLVNDYLRDVLQVAFIDSFCEDIDTIVGGYLKDRYGIVVHNAMISYEKSFFQRYLTRITDEATLDSLNENLNSSQDVNEQTSNKVFVLWLEGNYTISSASIHSSELAIPNTPSNTGIIYSIGDNQPELKTFCELLFSDNDVINYEWVQHLLLTSDGKIFMIEKATESNKECTLWEFNNKLLLP